jgi:hypothetical protein
MIICKAPQHWSNCYIGDQGSFFLKNIQTAVSLINLLIVYQLFSMQGAAIVSWLINAFKERYEKVLDLLNCLKIYLPRFQIIRKLNRVYVYGKSSKFVCLFVEIKNSTVYFYQTLS